MIKSKEIKAPVHAFTRQQAFDSDTNSLDGSVWSPGSTIFETNMSSAATLSSKDEKSLDKKSGFLSSISTSASSTNSASGWLRHRQRNNRRNRAMLSCIGLVVFVVLIGTVVLWVGSAFILPQNKYSTILSQVPKNSSYSFHRFPATASHGKDKTTTTSSIATATSTVTTVEPSSTSAPKQHRSRQH